MSAWLHANLPAACPPARRLLRSAAGASAGAPVPESHSPGMSRQCEGLTGSCSTAAAAYTDVQESPEVAHLRFAAAAGRGSPCGAFACCSWCRHQKAPKSACQVLSGLGKAPEYPGAPEAVSITLPEKPASSPAHPPAAAEADTRSPHRPPVSCSPGPQQSTRQPLCP